MKRIGYSLIELMATVSIIGIVSLMAASFVWKDIPEHQLGEDLKMLAGVISSAKSTAIKKSQMVDVDFSDSFTRHDDKGGLVSIVDQDGNVVKQEYLSSNVIVDLSTTLVTNILSFDYMGQPLGSNNTVQGFVEGKNSIIISSTSSVGKISKGLKITPLTGNIEFIEN